MLEISRTQGVILFFSGFMDFYPELCIIIKSKVRNYDRFLTV